MISLSIIFPGKFGGPGFHLPAQDNGFSGSPLPWIQRPSEFRNEFSDVRFQAFGKRLLCWYTPYEIKSFLFSNLTLLKSSPWSLVDQTPISEASQWPRDDREFNLWTQTQCFHHIVVYLQKPFLSSD